MNDSGRTADLQAARLARPAAVAPFAWRFLLDQVTVGLAGLAPLDALLVMAINQANIAPLTRDPSARAAYGALEDAAPDAQRRPASISAIAASLDVPFETARRRLRRLQAQDVCTITPGAGVIIPEAFLTSPRYLQSVVESHAALRRFHAGLAERGLLERLPPANYDIDAGVPMRGAARLIADFLLRAFDGLVHQAGDVVSALVLLATLVNSVTDGAPVFEAPLGARFRATSVSTLARTLSLPGETARRHAMLLIERGVCRRTSAGLTVAGPALERAQFAAMVEDLAAATQRLFAGLAERGVVDAWAAETNAASGRA